MILKKIFRFFFLTASHPFNLSTAAKQRFNISTFLILLLAAALRLWALSLKQPHFDEGINGWFADRLRQQGFYAYDPKNYHGPLYFYVLFVAQTLFGRNLWALRMPAVLGSIASVWIALRFDRFLGKRAARWGAATLAVSPAMVFYGRYAIHESWVAAALMLVLLGLFGLWHLGDRRSLFLTITGITLLILLKETAVIHFGSLLLATALLLLWHRWATSSVTLPFFISSSSAHKKVGFAGLSFAEQSWHYRDLCYSSLLSLGVIFFFYSGGFLNIDGFLNLFHTLSAWIHTGVETGGHRKLAYQWGPFNGYWLALMMRYEAPSLIGFFYSLWLLWRGSKLVRAFYKHLRSTKNKTTIEAASAFFEKNLKKIIRRNDATTASSFLASDENSSLSSAAKRHQIFWFSHYLALYGVSVLIIYSIIPYKTPWCLISLLWPFCLLFGVVLQQLNNKKIALLCGSLLLTISFYLCVRLNFWHYADFSEPYVYVQTSPEIERLTAPLLTMAKNDPRNFQLRGQILLESYYPLPWMLGDFTAISYFSKKKFPRNLDGDFIVIEASRSGEVEGKLHECYYREEFQLRDGMEKCVVYFKKSVFENYRKRN